MHVICSATVENEQQRDNLFDCVKILGGVPTIEGDLVSVEYMGDDMRASRMVALFEEFSEYTLVKQKSTEITPEIPR